MNWMLSKHNGIYSCVCLDCGYRANDENMDEAIKAVKHDHSCSVS